MSGKLTARAVTEAVREYESDESVSVRALAARNGVHYNAMYRALSDRTTLRPCSSPRADREMRANVLHLYTQHALGSQSIGELVGRAMTSVLRYLRSEGVAIRGWGVHPQEPPSCWCDLPERLRGRREEMSR